jgi:hypothetical protein
LELTELKHILRKTQVFFDEVCLTGWNLFRLFISFYWTLSSFCTNFSYTQIIKFYGFRSLLYFWIWKVQPLFKWDIFFN